MFESVSSVNARVLLRCSQSSARSSGTGLSLVSLPSSAEASSFLMQYSKLRNLYSLPSLQMMIFWPVPPHIDSLKPSSLHSAVGQPGANVPSGLRSTCLPIHTEPSAPLQPESHEVSFLRVGTVAL